MVSRESSLADRRSEDTFSSIRGRQNYDNIEREGKRDCGVGETVIYTSVNFGVEVRQFLRANTSCSLETT